MFERVQHQNLALTQMLQNATAQQVADRERRQDNGHRGEMDELRAVINPKLLEKCTVFFGKRADFVEW
eukprot:3709435-Heterocapsa_arctica.AAC.1